LISRYTKEVILAYDADEAGQKALNKAVELFKHTDVKVKIPALVGGKDPDEIIRKYGRDKFKGMLDGASNEIEFKLLDLRKKYNINTSQGKIDFLNEAIKILANVSPIEQDIYLNRLSDELGVEKSSIKIQLDSFSKRQQYRKKKSEYKSIVDNSMRTNQRLTFESDASLKQIKAEERMIGLLHLYPSCIELCRGFNSDEFSSPFIKKVYELLISRIDAQLDIDLINFSESLTDNELGMLSGIIARCKENNNYKKEFTDCITTIHNEYSLKNSKKSSEMTDDEFRKLFNKNT
jgi:DNA primase